MEASANRRAAAARLRDYFDIQLRLAEAISLRTREPIAGLVGHLTNFHLRFALGEFTDAPGEPWRAYVTRLGQLPTHVERLDWTEAFFAQCDEERARPNQPRFGCFRYVAPDADGVVRLHFRSQDDSEGPGPLSRARMGERLQELGGAFEQIRRLHPSATTVVGASWLYNLDAYRRLFPEGYGASRSPPQHVRMNGSSSWGQMLDHRGAVKPQMRDALLANLSSIDPEAPWRAFPLPPLATRAPIALFYEMYGV